MVGLENRLSELLLVKVDLTPAETMKQRVRSTADKEAVLAFLETLLHLCMTFTRR